jgi:hypothetical protein
MTITSIRLYEESFQPAERLQVQHGSITIESFRYSSGVAALRVGTGAGEVVILPFQGHQIWSANFGGRELGMKSMFPEPNDSRDLLAGYGAFFVHCGVSAMGRPAGQDTHPLHGELPNAPFADCAVRVGTDGDGTPYADIEGMYYHRIAFGINYAATSTVRVWGGQTRVRVSLSVENRRLTYMELMYMAHFNFRPATGSRIVATAPLTVENVEFRPWPPDTDMPKAHAEFLEVARKNPAILASLSPTHVLNPELVFSVGYRANEHGQSQTLQIHPDGTADFVLHRPAELPIATRWLVRTGVEDAYGIVLPGTAGPEGYMREKSRGRLVTVEPGSTWRCQVETGFLNVQETRAAVAMVERVNNGFH